MSDFGEQFVQRVVAKLEDKGATHALCPVCDRREWTINQDTIALLNHLGDEIRLAGGTSGMSAVAVVCKSCGFIRLHSMLHLFGD